MARSLIKNKIKRGQYLFYISFVTLPLLQFCIFYLGVNINSFVLAFRKYDILTGYSFAGFENFKRVFYDLGHTLYLKSALKNSVVLYLLSLCITTPLTLIFSFYIYKKMFFSGFIKVVLFLPTMLSSLIVVLLFKYFTDRALPNLWESLTGHKIAGLISDTKTALPTLMFFAVWSGFGSSILLYLGAMNGISESLFEAAKIDGASTFREFWNIVLPQVFPTLSVYLVTGVGGFFTNQMALYSFYGTDAEYTLYTLGYFLYRGIKVAETVDYPYFSAMGLVLTAVAIPLTYLMRFMLDKFGPQAD